MTPNRFKVRKGKRGQSKKNLTSFIDVPLKFSFFLDLFFRPSPSPSAKVKKPKKYCSVLCDIGASTVKGLLDSPKK